MAQEILGGNWLGDPCVIRWPDGRLEVLMIGMDGALYSKHQIGPNQGFTADWSRFDDDFRIGLHWERVRCDPLSARIAWGIDAEGLVTVFVRSVRGRIVYRYHDRGWSPWNSLSANQDEHPAIGNPVVVQARSGGLGIYARGVNNDLLLKVGSGVRSRDGWGDGNLWQSLGGNLASDPTILLGGDSDSHRLSICARGMDGEPWILTEEVNTHRHSPSPLHQTRGGRGSWRSLGCAIPAARLQGAPVQRGLMLGLVWRGSNGHLWNRFESPGFGNFRPNCDDSGLAIASDPVVLTAPGREYQFYQLGDGNLGMARFNNSTWEPVTRLASDIQGKPAAQFSENGRAEVFFRRSDGQLGHLWEESPGGRF